MRHVAKVLMLIGALAYVVALATLRWYEVNLSFLSSQTLWGEETLRPAIATGIAVIVAVLALVGLFTESVVLPGLAVSLSFLLLGLSVYTNESFNYSLFGPGYWVTGAVALVMAVGGLLSFNGYVLREPRSRARATPASPSAGWYEDPSGEARERYWTGGVWSEHTR